MVDTQFAGPAPGQQDVQAGGVGTASRFGVLPLVLVVVAVFAVGVWVFFMLGEIMVLALAVWLLAASLLAIWVYFDAKRQGLSGAWAFVAFFLFVLGLAIYLAVRELRSRNAIN